MERKRINAVLTVAALALTLLIPTALPLASTAAPRLERQPLESLTALNSTEATERDALLSVFSVPSVASVVQSPDTTTTADAQNVELVGHIGGQSYAIAIEGDYAYVGFGPELAVLDISDPTHPTRIGYVVLPDLVYDVAVAGDYAYIANWYAGLRVISVANPAQPTEVGYYDTLGIAIGVAVAGDYAYIADYDFGLRVISVADPTQPIEVGAYDTPGEAEGVAVAGGHAYVADYGSGLRVVDISNPAAPVEVGAYDTPGIAFSVYVAGGYAYVAGWPGLWVISVADPTQPLEVGYHDMSEYYAMSVAVAGDYAYVAGWVSLRVISVADPTQPMEVGAYDLPLASSSRLDVAVAGDYAYVADVDFGLRVISVADPAELSEMGSYDPPGNALGVAVAESYAYVVGWWHIWDDGKLCAISVADATHPTEVGYSDTPGYNTNVYGVAVAGSYAYVIGDKNYPYRGGWLQVISVADPTSPGEVGYCDTPGEARDVVVAGDYAYVAEQDAGLQVISVADPTQPVEMGHYDTPGYAVGVSVAGNYAYVADGLAGLRVISVADPTQPVEVGHYDMPGGAVGVAVAGGYTYVAGTSSYPNYNGWLRVISVADPTQPVEVGHYDMPGEAHYVAAVGDYAYVSDDEFGLWVIDISNPAAPVGVGFYDTPGFAGDIYVAGGYIYIANGTSGLFILRFTGGLPAGAATFTAIHPGNDSEPSTVMQGGVAHRYYTLRDASTGDLIPNATITLSAGGQGQSDANGIADLAMYADTLAGSSSLPVTPTVSVTGVWVGGDRYDVLSPPTFQVGIHPRSFTHEWNGGTVRKAKGGVSAGLVAYLGGQTKGGLGWELEETDASVDSDDTLKLKEEFEAELGGGIGIGAELGLKGWFSSASVGGSATTEAYARSLAEWQALFEDPYSDPQQKAQAAFVLAGLMDMAVGAPGQPMLAAILTRLAPSSDYAAYTDHVAAGVGAQWTPAHVHAGAEINLAKGLTKSALLELEALDAQAMLALFGTLTDYQHDQLWGLSLEQEVSVDVSALAVQTPIREKIGLYVGERTAKIKEELFLDKATGAPVKFELSFTGEGNELTFQDIVLQDVTYKFIVEGEDLNAALDAAIRNLTALMAAWEAIESQGLIVGRTAALREINAFLNSVPLSRYEVVAGTEGTLTLVPEIGFSAGVKVELGAGVEFKQGRELLIERGYATLTRLFPTEVYPDRQYGSTAGKSIWDLLGNAAHGAWLIVKDAFQSIVHSIQAGIEWTVDIIAQTADGIIHGGARLSSPGGGRLLLRSEGVLSSLEATSTITVTAASWVANEGGALQSLVQVSASPLDAAFVIGGVYQFTPEGLEIEPAATLEITYTAEALGGIDPAGLSIYRWDGNESAWQPLASTVDADNRVVTTTVGQLGTYAIGYDATPPVISIVEPVSGTTQATYYPWITALITDTGVGVDPASVALILDDTPILTADYYTYTHQLVYTPTIGLANGPHTVEVTARDTAGNEALASSTFTVNVPPPSIEAMTPTIVCGDVSTSVTISGTNFALMPTVQIETTPLSDVAYYGTTLVTTTVPATVAAGTYDVTVINPDSQSDTLPNGLTVSILGDFNCDCAVNVADIMIVANKWRCRSGDDCYDERYDIDKDNDIDIVDIMLVAVHWGETC